VVVFDMVWPSSGMASTVAPAADIGAGISTSSITGLDGDKPQR
jgi:hypothetical protein